MLRYLFYYLVAPGFIFSLILGALTSWIDRKLTARLQYRQGPPWYQPFADILKLLGKETIVPEGSTRLVFLSAPLLGLAAATLASTLICLFNLYPAESFGGDLIVVVYLLTVPSLAMILGGAASRNPLASLGISREMKLILAYELPFLISLAVVIAKSGSLLFSGILGPQVNHGMFLYSFSGFLAFLVSLLVVQAKLGLVPFDIAEAEQELMAGPLLEYSGTPLAIFKMTKLILFFCLPILMITLFMGGGGIWWFILKYILIVTLIVLIKNTNPRLRIDQALRFFWGPATALALLAFVLAVMGW
jgi:NADH-quinone oxidoreductase subunit H